MFDNYDQYEYLLARIQLVLFMLAMGATLSVGDFAPVFRQPKNLIYGLTNQLFLMALLAVLFNFLFQLPPGIAVGLLLAGALPGGTLSNVFTFISKGNVPLSIALSATATLLCIVTVPLVMTFLAADKLPANFKMPINEIMLDVFLCLLLPLAVGMAVSRYGPQYRKVVSHSCVYLGFFFVVVMVVGSLASERLPAEYFQNWRVHAAIILFCMVSQQLVMMPYRIAGAPPADWVALGNEVTVRNINLGLLLTVSMFRRDAGNSEIANGVLFVMLYYGATMMFVGLPLTIRIRRKITRNLRRAQAKLALQQSQPR